MVAMNNPTQSPFSQSAKTIPFNPLYEVSQPTVDAGGLTDEEQEILDAQRQIDNRRQELRDKKEMAELEQRNALFARKDKAEAAAKNFRREALLTANADEKKNLYEWAVEAELEVAWVEQELGIARKEDPAAVTEEKSWLQKNKGLMAIGQMLGVLVAIVYFHSMFNGIGEGITESNRGLPVESRLQPYDATSIQKLFYEKLVVFADLPIALLILFLIVPFIGFYVLPFAKSKRDFYTEFNEDLTPWQRSLLTTAFCLGLLFFLALSHNVKP